MSFEARAKELGIVFPELPGPAFSYVPTARTGNLVFISGQTPTVNGKPTITGKLGRDVTIEQAQEAARLCVLNGITYARNALGSLDNIARIVKVNGYVASAEGFGNQPTVINGASDFLEELFGEAGKHARAAIGVSELPFGVPVEVEMIIEVKPT